MPTFNDFGSGGAVVAGSGRLTNDFALVATGGVNVEGANAGLQLAFFVSPTFLWIIKAYFVKDITFLWNVGQLRLLWYRLVGKGKNNQCNPINVQREPCCQKYIMNVHARTLTELCEKLHRRRWKWPIESVEVFSRPASNADVAADEAAGINHDCNITEIVDVCKIPECADFCVDSDVYETIGVDFRATRQESFVYEATGDIFIGGAAPIEFTYNGQYDENGFGGIVVGGAADESVDSLPEGVGVFFYEASGEVIIGGSSPLVSSSYQYEASGFVTTGGSAGTNFITLGDINTNIGVDMSLEILQVIYSEDVDSQDMVGPATLVAKCLCPNMPLEIQFSHNLIRNNVFTQFLLRNGLSAPSTMNMKYNSINDSWQANLFYTGVAPDSNTREVWTLVFELQCTDLLGSVELGENVWRASIQIVRRNMTTFQDFDTRIFVAILPEAACSSSELQFVVTYNTQSDIATVAPDSIIYQSIIYDNIGLFKTPFWIRNPNLVLQLTQIGVDSPQTRVNLDSILIPS